MDFSGRTGRVIDNPVEAQSAAVEEGQTWRVSRGSVNAILQGRVRHIQASAAGSEELCFG